MDCCWIEFLNLRSASPPEKESLAGDGSGRSDLIQGDDFWKLGRNEALLELTTGEEFLVLQPSLHSANMTKATY